MTGYRADDLKIMALHWLRGRYPGALLIPEFCAAKYGDAMIDVAAVTDTELIGIEIKGDGDSPARLERQGWVYSRTATRMYLLPSPSLLTAAQKHRPRGWGLITVRDHALECGWHKLDKLPNAPAALLDILWKPELLRAGRACGLSLNRSAPVYKIAEKIAEAAPLGRIRSAVLAELLARDWVNVSLSGKTVYQPGAALPIMSDG